MRYETYGTESFQTVILNLKQYIGLFILAFVFVSIIRIRARRTRVSESVPEVWTLLLYESKVHTVTRDRRTWTRVRTECLWIRTQTRLMFESDYEDAPLLSEFVSVSADLWSVWSAYPWLTQLFLSWMISFIFWSTIYKNNQFCGHLWSFLSKLVIFWHILKFSDDKISTRDPSRPITWPSRDSQDLYRKWHGP